MTSLSFNTLMTHSSSLKLQLHNFFFLKGILQFFSDSTGLRINFSKSMMVPINISNEKLVHLARTFGCATGSFPFTYLGLPMGISRPRVDDFLPLINKCEEVELCLTISESGW
jgi:hypothetical protein